MADYPTYHHSQAEAHYSAQLANQDSLHRSYTHNSHYSHATTSTRSWVQTNQQNPPPPPIEDYGAEQSMSPVRTPRPLPQPQIRPQTFYTVNASDNPEDEEEEYMNIDPNVSGQYDFQHVHLSPRPGVFGTSPEPLRPPPSKQKSFVGGFVRGLRKLPKRMMGYGVSNEKGRLFRRGTFGTEASGTSAGMTTGNTLPLYRSNPSTPVAGPSNIQYVQDVQMAFAPRNTVPEVVREDPIPQALLSGGALRRATPTFRVTPPSDESHAQILQSPQPQFAQVVHPDPVAINHPERTTVMVYSDSVDHGMPASEPAGLQRTPSRTPRTSGAPTRMPSITIQAPLAQPPPPMQAPPPIRTPPPPAEQDLDMVQSPATEHPLPTADYRKMPHFPGSPSRNTMMTATGTSWYDPSFGYELTPVERFFKTLYNLPWVSHGRVTIDYRPDKGLDGKLKRKGLVKKPMASWYRRFSRSSRNAELDLLSNDTPRTTPRTSLGTSIPSSLASPRSSTKRSTGSRHHRSHNNHRRRHRNRRRSMSTIEEPERTESPMLPAVYPYAYPAYPFTYPGYAAVPPALQVAAGISPPTSPAGAPNQMQMQMQMAAMQVPMPIQPPQQQQQHHSSHRHNHHSSGSKRTPRGPRSRNTRKPTYPGGYSPYQAMAFPPPPPPPPIYMTQQQPHQQNSPGGGSGGPNNGGPQMQQQHQGQLLHQVYVPMQVIPGAFGAVQDLNVHDSTMSSIPSPPSSPTPKAGSAAQ